MRFKSFLVSVAVFFCHASFAIEVSSLPPGASCNGRAGYSAGADVSIVCDGDLSLSAGHVFSARSSVQIFSAGRLFIDSVIFVAPTIDFVANDIDVIGNSGFFSGDFFSLPRAYMTEAGVRSEIFTALNLTPYVHPLYGSAGTFFVPDVSGVVLVPLQVPEPAGLGLAFLGIALIGVAGSRNPWARC